MTTIVTVCDTCKRPDFDPETTPETDGFTLFRRISAALEADKNIDVRSFSCLMGCDFACNVTIQGPEKLAYVAGTFTPEGESAEAIAAFARLYDDSETGRVPYKQWPEGMKGHFRARLVPADS